MSIFKGDPVAALEKTKAKQANVEQNLISLRAKRAETLLSAEDAGAVIAIDKAIDIELSNATIYADRIRALREGVRKSEYAAREQQRKQAIEKISEKLKKREAIAKELELSLARTGHLFSELLANDEVSVLWPFPQPRHGWAQLDTHGVNKELGWASFGLCREHGFPEPNSRGLGVVGISALGVAEHVRQQNANIIARLEAVSIADDLLEESA